MSRWSESRQLPRNCLVTSWRLPRNICYGEVTGKLVPVEFELKAVPDLHLIETVHQNTSARIRSGKRLADRLLTTRGVKQRLALAPALFYNLPSIG